MFCHKTMNKRLRSMGGSLGLVVMRGDSRLRRFGLESQHQILDGHFSQYIVIKTCKNCNVCLRNTKNQRKRGQEWPIFIKKRPRSNISFHVPWWWWSSGQRACLQLRRSEFKSSWSLYSDRYMQRTNIGKRKRGRDGNLFEKVSFQDAIVKHF